MGNRQVNSDRTYARPWLFLCCSFGAAALLLALQSAALAITPTASATMTPTPTATPCTTFPEPNLSVSLQVQPAHPVVGDQVLLTFSASAPGGLPSCTVFGFEPVLAGSPPAVTNNTFPVSAQFELTAAQAGTAMVSLSVNFETPYGCTENPYYSFVTLSSDPFPVDVAPVPTPSATPTAAQSQNDEGGSCSLKGPARADYTVLLLALPVVWFLRRRRDRSCGQRTGG
jgi:hypothetical protein